KRIADTGSSHGALPARLVGTGERRRPAEQRDELASPHGSPQSERLHPTTSHWLCAAVRMVVLRGLSSPTREHGEMPLRSAFVEVEDVKGTLPARDFAIAVIGTVPLVEDFDHLDPIHLQTKRPRYLNPMVLAGLDHDAHVYASAAAQALSKRSIPSVHALHAEGKVGGRRRSIAVVHPVRSTPNRVAQMPGGSELVAHPLPDQVATSRRDWLENAMRPVLYSGINRVSIVRQIRRAS